jgi:hypothetical protein
LERLYPVIAVPLPPLGHVGQEIARGDRKKEDSMNGKTHKIRRAVSAFALIASVAGVAIPAAVAGNTQAGMVPSKLGSPDPRESQKVKDASDFIARNYLYGTHSNGESSVVAIRLGSDAAQDLAVKNYGDFVARNYLYGTHSNGESSVVAIRLGSPDVRDSAIPRGAVIGTDGLNGDFMFRDYLRGTHFTRDSSSVVARQLGSPDIRDAAQKSSGNSMLTDFSGMHWASPLTAPPVVDATQASTDDGINWGKFGIGIAVAVCGLLLLVALGIGARQVRHGGHRLGSA